jgi:uncharacterized protein YjiS (DUF1127 family)
MSCAEKYDFEPNTALPSHWRPIWYERLCSVWRRLRRLREIQRQRRALRELDTHQLADIGVTREQARREASRLF